LISAKVTDRLYYSDSYTRQFTARVVERLTLGNCPALILDQTFFYPTSGGQPNDRGTINGVRVEEVIVRKDDNAVAHVLADPILADSVEAALDWPRRFDHMQQHSGQHILSQAFLRLTEAETVSFHLGDESVTIDVAADKLSAAQLDSVEDLANTVVTADLPVRAWFPALDELATLTLRKTPEVDGPLRVVAIGGFDFNACGGTHVARTGEIGLIKILKIEREKKNTRVEFRCGGRALADYRRRAAIVNQLAADFTCGLAEVPEAVNKLRAEAGAWHKELKAAKETLLAHEATELLASAPVLNGWRIIRQAWTDRDLNDLRALAQRLAAAPGTVALLGLAGDRAQLLFARAADVDRDMAVMVKAALTALGARGGGTPQLAQGGGVRAELETIEKVLRQAEDNLIKTTNDRRKSYVCR